MDVNHKSCRIALMIVIAIVAHATASRPASGQASAALPRGNMIWPAYTDRAGVALPLEAHPAVASYRLRIDTTASRRRKNAVIGAVVGGLAGAVLGNAYARAHLPPCLPTPGGFCVRSGDHSAGYKIAGIGLGSLLGAWIGVSSSREPAGAHRDPAP